MPNEKNDKEKDALLKQILVQNISTSWYQEEMRRVIAEIQEIEENVEFDSVPGSRYHQLQGMLGYLLGKGLFERRILLVLREKVRLLN